MVFGKNLNYELVIDCFYGFFFKEYLFLYVLFVVKGVVMVVLLILILDFKFVFIVFLFLFLFLIVKLLFMIMLKYCCLYY